jgi:predicted aspartyl protease
MSDYHVNLIATNPKREEIRAEPVLVLVDTGSELSWLPTEVLLKAGICPRRKRAFTLADGRTMVRDVGFCILEAEGFITADEIVFGEPGDLSLLGVRTLEGFGVVVDPVLHRMIRTLTIVAATTQSAHPRIMAAS